MNILQISYERRVDSLVYKNYKNAEENYRKLQAAASDNGGAAIVELSDDFDRKMLISVFAAQSIVLTSMAKEQELSTALQASTPRGLVPAGGQHMRFPQQ